MAESGKTSSLKFQVSEPFVLPLSAIPSLPSAGSREIVAVPARQSPCAREFRRTS
jgi:hypothetical protein